MNPGIVLITVLALQVLYAIIDYISIVFQRIFISLIIKAIMLGFYIYIAVGSAQIEQCALVYKIWLIINCVLYPVNFVTAFYRRRKFLQRITEMERSVESIKETRTEIEIKEIDSEKDYTKDKMA